MSVLTYISEVPSLLRDRDKFVIWAAVLGTGLGLLNLFYALEWGRLLAALMLPALIVRAVWRSMPGWLLLSWVTIPTLVGDAAVVTRSAYLVVITALAVVAASRTRRLDTVVIRARADHERWVVQAHLPRRLAGAPA